jgi:hypothetical protein
MELPPDLVKTPIQWVEAEVAVALLETPAISLATQPLVQLAAVMVVLAA